MFIDQHINSFSVQYFYIFLFSFVPLHHKILKMIKTVLLKLRSKRIIFILLLHLNKITDTYGMRVHNSDQETKHQKTAKRCIYMLSYMFELFGRILL